MVAEWARKRLGALVGTLAAVLPSAGFAEEIVIGTGSLYGVYYQVGRGICRMVERHTEGIDCSAVPTAGSLFNLDGVRDGALEFGVVQSDWQYHAVKQSGPFAFSDVRYDNLRALFSVHGEPFTLVARRDSGIRALDDIEGRRVNLGNPGSGQRATMEVVMAARGWTESSFALAEELPASQQSLALCHDRIDAMVYVVGHPNESIRRATVLCGAVIVDVAHPAIDRLVAENPFYSYTVIPGGLYPGNPDDIRTFGVRATVVAAEELDADLVYEVVKAVFENLESFQRLYPAFGALKPETMAREGLSAPLHEGALRYYREKGLM